MNDYKIIAFDPGKTTGIVLLSVDLVQKEVDLVLVEQLNFWKDADWRKVVELFRISPHGNYTPHTLFDEIVIEDFRLRADKAREQVGLQMVAAKAIGHIEAMAKLACPDVPITFQQPSERRKIKVLGDHQLQLKGKRHAKDAYMHALLKVYKIMFGNG